MPLAYRCKYCHGPVSPGAQHVCESTGEVRDEEDFLELAPTKNISHGNKQDAFDDQDDEPSTEEDHEREFD